MSRFALSLLLLAVGLWLAMPPEALAVPDLAPPDSLAATSAPLDPGRDPEFEQQRRQSGFGRYGLLLPAYVLLLGLAVLGLFHRQAPRWLLGAVLVLTATAGTVGALEGVFRLTSDRWAAHVKIRSNCYHSNPRGYFLRSEMAGHPDISAWCVDPLDATWAACESPGEEARIREPAVLALGDSFTDGVGVFRRDAWPQQLERMLTDEGEPVAVVNCGRADYDARQVLARFRAISELYRPRRVIYAMTLNDIPPPVPSSSPAADVSFQVEDRSAYLVHVSSHPVFGPLARHSALGRFVIERLVTSRVARATERLYAGLLDDPQRPGVRDAFAAVEEMAALSREKGAEFHVLIWPMVHRLRDYPFRATHQRIVDELERRGISCLDLLPAFEGEKDEYYQVHPTDFHPNERAHAKAAEAIRRRWLVSDVDTGKR